MITIDNYYTATSNFIWSNFPEAIQKGHEYMDKATEHGQNWEAYHSSEAVKKVIDLYLTKLNEASKSGGPGASARKKHSAQVAPASKPTPKTPSSVKKEAPSGGVKKQKTTPTGNPEQTASLVERIPEELRMIRRFVNMNGKVKEKDELLRFINSLQKAIVEKRIRKTSDFAEQIRFIQDKLIEVYNTMKAKIKIELKPETYDALQKLVGGQKVLSSINFIKRYIGMNGKAGMKEKAGQLLDQINRAMDKGKITDSDPYIIEIHELKKNLKTFISNKAPKALGIEKATLNGLNGILGCSCESLNGPDDKPLLMNSMDFANMQFTTIGLTGKWYDLIGDPSPNFTAMVFGKPKMGKSYLCIELAGFLARHHGKVLYVAKEEGLDMTLQKKLADKQVAHPNLTMASELPADLGSYNFIFLDSVNKLGLKPDDLTRIRSDNPSKSFIFIFQTTKDGNFRGANSFQHDVDVVIEIPHLGKAVQFGRFNQGGEIDIFT